MFAIYNIQGRSFRSTLEQLHKVHRPHANQASDIHTNTAQDETVVIQGNDTEMRANAKNVAAYREMVHANERTVIVHAYQIMTHPVKTLLSNTSIQKALEEFDLLGYQQMPIINPEHQLVGILTYQQIYKMAHSRERHADTIEKIMSPEVITVDPISDIRRVARVLYEYQLSALPVVNEQDHLVGIISKTDMLKALIKDPPLSLWT
ncbi:HPP family protein [Thiomicrorhabdus indica]|uniref:CBS domain-containing protein n=1 Tax=Thiomicrorhabdus indica TaxID=2267253 RepID=UPI002AA61DB3|nr:CBS domain-containing protein [Thiomicrorhabdus indica]